MPQAFIGRDASVQLSVSLLQVVVLNPRMPMPDRMFQVATLNVSGCVDVETVAPDGCAGDPSPHATVAAASAQLAAAIAASANRP
jgi:hypothetical protein